MYFKPSRKNPDFGFLPLPSKLKNPYLNNYFEKIEIFAMKEIFMKYQNKLENAPCIEINIS